MFILRIHSIKILFCLFFFFFLLFQKIQSIVILFFFEITSTISLFVNVKFVKNPLFDPFTYSFNQNFILPVFFFNFEKFSQL